jgi:hypothetical protein
MLEQTLSMRRGSKIQYFEGASTARLNKSEVQNLLLRAVSFKWSAKSVIAPEDRKGEELTFLADKAVALAAAVHGVGEVPAAATGLPA